MIARARPLGGISGLRAADFSICAGEEGWLSRVESSIALLMAKSVVEGDWFPIARRSTEKRIFSASAAMSSKVTGMNSYSGRKCSSMTKW